MPLCWVLNMNGREFRLGELKRCDVDCESELIDIGRFVVGKLSSADDLQQLTV